MGLKPKGIAAATTLHATVTAPRLATGLRRLRAPTGGAPLTLLRALD
jgi:hypothetical protein